MTEILSSERILALNRKISNSEMDLIQFNLPCKRSNVEVLEKNKSRKSPAYLQCLQYSDREKFLRNNNPHRLKRIRYENDTWNISKLNEKGKKQTKSQTLGISWCQHVFPRIVFVLFHNNNQSIERIFCVFSKKNFSVSFFCIFGKGRNECTRSY